MTTTFEIPTASLAAAVTHAPKQDVRTYLVGVYVDTDKGRLVATDGHRMFVCSCPAVRADFQPPFIIPRALIVSAVKAANVRVGGRKAATVTVSVTKENEFQRVTLTANSASFSDFAYDGTYPQYQRVIPTETSGAPGWYNPQYLAEAYTAIDTFHGKNSLARVYYNGHDKPGIVTSPVAEALVVVMPLRVGDNPEPSPALDWYRNAGTV